MAQLWLDDTMLAEELEPITGVDLSTMTISVMHQYAGNFSDQTVDHTLKRGSTYAIVYDFGGSRLGKLVEKRERQMQAYRESGLTDTSRQVLTESLNVIGHDDAVRMTDLTQFNNTYTRYTYDNANRLTALENRLSNAGSPIATYAFTLDNNGNRTNVTQTVPISLNATASNTNFTMNLQKNRLQQAGSASFTYDNEGQLATRTGDNYTFDDAHRLTGITGSVSYQYKYDGAGNRLEATRNGATTRYIYDTNGNLLAEADGTNAITRYYIYGNGLLAMVTSGNQPYCYHFDGTGHTVALTDSSANIVNRYAYTPFGAIGNQQEAISQPFKYVAKYGVMAEPNGLYYMKARYYDPSVGRFISEDPKGFDGGDVNLMAYTGNNPVMKTDPSGESGFTTGFEGAGTAFGFGGTVGIYGNFAHDSNKPWYKGWSSSVTFVAGGGAAASVYGAAAGVHFSGNNANNVSDLNGTFLNAGRAGLGALSLGGYRSPDGSVTGAGITVGPAVGYIGGIAGGSYTWTLGGGKWY